MAGSDKTATFSIKVEASADSALKGAYDLGKFRDAIKTSQEVIKQYTSNLRNLRGTSDEVKAAKLDLKARIDAERDAISRATLAIQKHGSTVKGAGEQTRGFGGAIKAVGGPVSDLTGKTSALKEVFAALASPMGIAVVGATALIAVVTALTVATIELGGANRALMTNLEGTTGSAKNAAAFSHQIDALAQKLPLAREKLYELASGMAETWGQSRITGQGIQDSFDAVATVTSGMSARAGAALQSIIDQGKTFGRIGLGYAELRPLGLRIEDVYARIAKNAGRSYQDVAQLSMQGMLNVNAFAQAVKQVSHERFDPVIGKKFIDLDVIATRFKSNLTGLFKGANIEAFLGSLSRLVGLFDENTTTGKQLQSTISEFAGVLNVLATALLPSADVGLRSMAVGSLHFATGILKAATAVVLFVKSENGLLAIKLAVAAIALAAAGVSAPFIAAATAVMAVVDQVKKLRKEMVGVTFSDLLNPFKGAGNLPGASAAAGSSMMAPAGLATATAHASGGMVTRPAPGEFFASVAPGEHIVPAGSQVAGAGGGGSAGPVEVHFHIGGAGGEKAAQALQSGSVLANVTHAIETALRAAGYPTQATVAS